MSSKIKSKSPSSKKFSSPQRSFSNAQSPQKANTEKPNLEINTQKNKYSFSPSKYYRSPTRSGQRSLQYTSYGVDAGLTQTREQMIQKYLDLADQYRAELRRRDQLHEEQQKVQAGIASIFIQGDRIDELIKKVKETQQPEAPDD